MVRRETVTIRVTPRTNAALNIFVEKLKLMNPGTKITQDEAIWNLIQKTEPDVIETVIHAESHQQNKPSDS